MTPAAAPLPENPASAGTLWPPCRFSSVLKARWETGAKKLPTFGAQLYALGYEVQVPAFPVRPPRARLSIWTSTPRPTWYDWRIDTFGTKWEPYDSSLGETESCLLYHFQSAWSPPVAFVQKLIVRYPELRFNLRFKESGVGFMGEVTETSAILDADLPDYPDGDDPEYDRLVERYYEAITDYLEGA